MRALGIAASLLLSASACSGGEGLDGGPGAHDAATDGRLDAARDDASGTVAGPCSGAPPSAYDYEVGVSVFGANDYVEYIPGDLPIILAAPHGGTLEPAELPPDDSLARDSGSLETALLVQARLRDLTGRTPHVVINHVARNRLNLARPDARPNETAPTAIRAWEDFHRFVEAASEWVTAACGRGHYFDFHTNGHDGRWVEVGTGLTVARLELPDAELEGESANSYYRALAAREGISFVEVVRGPTSLGGLLEAAGIRAVPTPANPDPDGMDFFIGGYNPARHGSRDEGVIDGTHLEMHFSYVNAGVAERERFSAILADAMRAFLETHYGFDLAAP